MKKREKELRKLKRSELLELMVAQSEEIDSLRAEVADLKEKLNERIVHIEEAGSIAQAAVQMSGILGAAQMAADIYLQSISQIAAEKQTRETDPVREDNPQTRDDSQTEEE